MGSVIGSMLAELDECTVAQEVLIPHDEARVRFHLHRNTVSTYGEFEEIIGRYYNHHASATTLNGGVYSQREAQAKAKEILVNSYKRKDGDATITTAFVDARDGTEGGMRAILDHIADRLKQEALSHYTTEIFDAYVSPASFEQRVEIMRQLIRRVPALARHIEGDRPERYASDWQQLVRAYVAGLKWTGAAFRRV